MPTMRPMPLNSGRIYAHSSDSDDYELAAKIGQGKYSEVFSGYNILNAKKVAVKLLKDVRLDKVRREAKILGLLSEGGHRGHNTLVEVCRERGTQKVLLVTEFIDEEGVDEAMQQVQHMRLGRDALIQSQFHSPDHNLFVVMKHQSEDIGHLTITAGTAKHLVL